MTDSNSLSSSSPGTERLVFRPDAERVGDVLVVILLRGGMDALHAVPPIADPDYFASRGAMALGEPGRPQGTLELDGFFGLHPRLAFMHELYQAKRMAIVHACGSEDRTLSHFETQRTVETGGATANSSSDGWIGRHLTSWKTDNDSPLRAISVGNHIPDSLSGAPLATALPSLDEFKLTVPPAWSGSFPQLLRELYAAGNDAAAASGRSALRLLKILDRLRAKPYQPEGKAAYVSELGYGLREVAQLIKADVGLEVATLEFAGWDTHIEQQPRLHRHFATLARNLWSFDHDLGERMRHVTVVALTEFGRRVKPNSVLGTDHGRGTAMFVLGGGIRGGKVYGRWPGLRAEQLDGGNLAVTTDFRSVLAEVLARRLNNRQMDQVFPGFQPEFLDLAEPRADGRA